MSLPFAIPHRYHHCRIAAATVARRALCAPRPLTPLTPYTGANDHHHHHVEHHHQYHHLQYHRSIATTATTTGAGAGIFGKHRNIANHRDEEDRRRHQQETDLNIVFYNLLELLRTPLSSLSNVSDVEKVVATVHELNKREHLFSSLSGIEQEKKEESDGDDGQEQAGKEESLESVLFPLLAKLLVQTNTDFAVESEIVNYSDGSGDGTAERDWMERQLMDAMSLVLHCREVQQESARVNWVHVVIQTAELAIHHSYGNSKRIGTFLELWLDLMVLRPLENISDQRIRGVIEQIRQDFQKKKHSKAAQLCIMVFNGILRHCEAQVLDIIHKILDHSHIRVSRKIIFFIIYRGRFNVSPKDKWDLVVTAHKKNGFLPNPSAFSHLLFECIRQNDWNTARKCADFIWTNGVTIDSAIAIRLLDVERFTRSVSDALQVWASLGYTAGEHVKWDGVVVNAVFTMCVVHKKNQFWQKVMREVLNRAHHESGGQWPTAFFHTESQKKKFIKTSETFISLLNKWEGRPSKDTETSYATLALDWKRFMDDHLQRFGDSVR